MNFHLIIAKVNEQLYNGEAKSITLPGSGGYFTVLAKHEPLVTTLKRGEAQIESADGTIEKFTVHSGLVEVSNNRAIVLL